MSGTHGHRAIIALMALAAVVAKVTGSFLGCQFCCHIGFFFLLLSGHISPGVPGIALLFLNGSVEIHLVVERIKRCQ